MEEKAAQGSEQDSPERLLASAVAPQSSEPASAVSAPAVLPALLLETPTLQDIKAIYDMAKQGLARLPRDRRVAPRHAEAYRRVRLYLTETGALPR